MIIVWIGVVLAAIVLISPVNLWLDYRQRGKAATVLVQVSIFWGLFKPSLSMPVSSPSSRKNKSANSSSAPSLSEIRGYLSILSKNKKWLRRLKSLARRAIAVKRFVWQTDLGLHSSLGLAQLTGTLWAAKGMASARLGRLFKFRQPPVLRIHPHFNRTYFRTAITCILEFHLGYAIIAGIFTVLLALKFKHDKRGVVGGRSSNPRADEDSHGEYQRNGGRKYCNR